MGYRLRVAVEDRFLVICLREERALLPEQETLHSILAAARSLDSGIQILCDLRGLRTIYNDITETLKVMVEHGAQLLAPSRDIAFLQSELGGTVDILPVSGQAIPMRFADLPLLPFDPNCADLPFFGTWEPFSRGLDTGLPTEQDWAYIASRDLTAASVFSGASDLQRHWESCLEQYRLHPSNAGGTEVLQRRYLQRFIDRNRRRSLLSHFNVDVADGVVHVRPYHAGALNMIEAGKEIILGRPGIRSNRTREALGVELLKFEELISDRKTKEVQIQRFLEQHPTILEALGYRSIYPQIVLARDDGTSLRPDFILEPIGSPWCEILDLKLPGTSIAVGRRDRKMMAAAVHELVAQLREYGAYFENERLAKRVEDVYGIKCYRPRLVGVIGRDPNLADERQKRRMMTAYSDVSVVTFDEVLKIARTRLLI